MSYELREFKLKLATQISKLAKFQELCQVLT